MTDRYFVARHGDGSPSALARVQTGDQGLDAWRRSRAVEGWEHYPALVRLVVEDPDFVWDEISASQAGELEHQLT